MGKITSESLLDLLYNKKLPQVYRDEDSKLGFPLKRYLESLIEGGFYGIIKDIEGIMSLVDPTAIPDEYFPYLCESFGLPYFPDMDTSYQKKFLANVGELNRRRGTFAGVRYLTRALTGLESNLTYYEGEYLGQDGNYLFIELLAKSLEEINGIDVSKKVILDCIGSHVPYYVKPILTSRIANQLIGSKSYSHSVVSYNSFYTIKGFKEDN